MFCSETSLLTPRRLYTPQAVAPGQETATSGPGERAGPACVYVAWRGCIRMSRIVCAVKAQE